MNGTPQEILEYNREAWDSAVRHGNQWSIPVTRDEVAAARRGEWHIVLTPVIHVPRAWFPPLVGAEVLCLASGGGQQGPILAAAGANVTVLDNSPAQLARDAEVALRDMLPIRTLLGDMANLEQIEDGVFDLIVHPVSNIFVPDVLPVWREAFRVLKPGGVLLAGFCNPHTYLFDQFEADEGRLHARHALPYSDLTHLTEEERATLRANEQPLEWSHTLEEQIGGQLAAGFVITGFYEDGWFPPGAPQEWENPIDRVMKSFMATRAVKG